MKIIDFEKKGNVVRFYLGKDDCEDYHGDDWDDRPYDCNAGTVYDEYITGHRDIAFPFNFTVLEPKDEWCTNCEWCKDDMKARKVPCIVAVKTDDCLVHEFSHYLGADHENVIKFYFGDKMAEGRGISVFAKKELLC